MKKNNSRQNFLQQTGACVLVLVIGSLALTGDGDAATATGTANATVVESVSISISPPPTPALSGTVFTVERFTSNLSTSGPLLRIGAPPPTSAAGTSEVSATGAGATPAVNPANTATVSVTRNADGSMGVSGGSGLTFAVSRPEAGVVNIEYN